MMFDAVRVFIYRLGTFIALNSGNFMYYVDMLYWPKFIKPVGYNNRGLNNTELLFCMFVQNSAPQQSVFYG